VGSSAPSAGTDIAIWRARLEVLLQDMSVRQAGGLQKRQGRFKKDDTARKRFINTVALPSLRAGVLPSAHDEKMLFLGPMDNKALSAQDKTELEKWVSLVYKDSRARQPPSELDVKRQTTLLEWAKQNAQFCAVPRHSAGDGDHGYKVAFGRYKDSLVSALVKTAQTNNGGGGAGPYLLWVCGQTQSPNPFMWRWHDMRHVRFFLGLHAAYRRNGNKLTVRNDRNTEIDLKIKDLAHQFYRLSDVREWMEATHHAVDPDDPDADAGALDALPLP